MPSFMIETEIIVNQPLEISGDDAHHIKDVLRLKMGNWIVISDGKGSRFKCEITEIDKKTVTAIVKEKLPELKLADITLAQAITKYEKIELIIHKAVELGVTKIIPFSSSRTIPKFSEAASLKKIERWNKIALEASKQCGLTIKPVVELPQSFINLIKCSYSENKLMFYEGEKSRSISDYFGEKKEFKSTTILIGPEGGFAPEEVALATQQGFTTLKLGPLILRVETASISAITLVQYFMKYFD